MPDPSAPFYDVMIYGAEGARCPQCLGRSFERRLTMFPMRFVATCLDCGLETTCDLKLGKPPAPPPAKPSNPFDGFGFGFF